MPCPRHLISAFESATVLTCVRWACPGPLLGDLLVVSQPAAKDGDADDTPASEEAAPAEPAAAAAVGGADRGVWKL